MMARIRQAKFMEKGGRPQFSSYTHTHLLVANAAFVNMYFQIISDLNASQVFNRGK